MSTKPATVRLLKEYPEALKDGVGAVFVGAGVSMAAGYPSWAALLHEIGEELGVDSTDTHDLAALAQWSIQESGGATRVRQVLKEELGADKPIPEALEIIARLPTRHVWTTNYDRLIERAFRSIGRPIDSISSASDLALRASPGATRLYKMHGSIDRLDDVVISTDDYELFRAKRGPYLPLLQAHLTSMSMLFVGLSFTDPNIRHVLSLIRESFTQAPPEHFAIVRPPQRDDFGSDEEFKARIVQHNLWAKDLRRYGLVAVEIDSYDEVPELLRKIERRVAARRIWVSGSWPFEAPGKGAAKSYALAESIGRYIGHSGLDLISGVGLLVGPAAVGGFLDGLRADGSWDVDRRLVVRPFPQGVIGGMPTNAQWLALRQELARQAGVVIFIGGLKDERGRLVAASGVLEEFILADASGAFLLPIGATGGAAEEIAQTLMGSSRPSTGSLAVRPTDKELELLGDEDAPSERLFDAVTKILARVTKAA